MKIEDLRAIRKRKRITQAELAKHLGISRELFGFYENGVSTPRLALLEQWCNYLNVELIIREL